MFFAFFLYYVRVERVYEDIRGSIAKRSINVDVELNKLPLVIQKVTALMGILVHVLSGLITIILKTHRFSASFGAFPISWCLYHH